MVRSVLCSCALNPVNEVRHARVDAGKTRARTAVADRHDATEQPLVVSLIEAHHRTARVVLQQSQAHHRTARVVLEQSQAHDRTARVVLEQSQAHNRTTGVVLEQSQALFLFKICQ